MAVHVCAGLLLLGHARQEPTFRAQTRTVVVQVTVQDRGGELITNLDRDAFSVYEDGKAQAITVFSRDDAPVSLGLVIDNSGSMQPLRPRVERAAMTLVRASRADDEVFVVNFANEPRVDVPFTSDRQLLERGVVGADRTSGLTALRDALALAEVYVSRGRHQRKVLVAVSDGRDNGSQARSAIVRDLARRHGIQIYAIGIAAAPAPSPDRRALDGFARLTGGMSIYPPSTEAIDDAASTIAHQIRSQYTIGYVPANQRLDGRYRRISVTIPGAPGLNVHARDGYIASASQ